MPKKFTILSSNYNKAKYLKDWANSIIIQKYRPLEVILADDKSTDNSKKVMKEIEKNFIRSNIECKFIYNRERLYCGSSYKNLVSFGTGNFFGVVDADDMLISDAVDYIINLYNKYKKVSWIYTQFLICDTKMRKKRKGFNKAPSPGESLLSLADKGIHGYGHWRTFSDKIKDRKSLYCKGLTCSVDKYMGYKLEEMGVGMFADRICYKYRQYPIGFKESVSSTKYAMKIWKKVIAGVHKRREKKFDIFPIIIHRK